MNTVIKASAGTGKTYTLVEDIVRKISEEKVSPSRIIAVTFTEKAAEELRTRIQKELSKAGRHEDAFLIGSAMIGTVHAVCNTLIRRFPVESGTVPDAEIIDERQADLLFRRALSAVFEEIITDGLSAIETRLDMKSDDVIAAALEIADAARSNRIRPDRLEAMGEFSIEKLSALLGPEAAASQETLRETWIRELDRAIEDAKAGQSGRKINKYDTAFIDDMNTFRSELEKGNPPWNRFLNFLSSSVKNGAAIKEQVRAITEAMSAHQSSPLFRSDMSTYIRTVFRIAAAAVSRYQSMKRSNSFIDYTDMESSALELIENPAIRNALASEFGILYVDEFQDTSPLQLAIFLQLGKLIGSMTWVGDRKQSIYAFRNADPELMEKAYAKLLASDAKSRVLDISYRTRPGLAAFLNGVFVPHFTAQGDDRAEVELKHKRPEDPSLPSSPVEFWFGEAAEDEKYSEAIERRAISEGIRRLLSSGQKVYDRNIDGLRPIRGSDIAVLCMTNDRIDALAAHLERHAISCSFSRSGLFRTEEGAYLLAALGLSLDPKASFEATLLAFLEHGGRPDEYIARSGICREPASCASESIREICAIREESRVLTPSSLMRTLARRTSLRELCVRWGNETQRLMNVDRIIALADDYEKRALIEDTVPTHRGLHAALMSASRADTTKEAGQGCTDDPSSVNLLTYHRSKGLEWPVVVLADLFDVWKIKPGRALFGKAHVLQQDELSDDILRGRSLLFIPWPYNENTMHSPLSERGAEDPVFAGIAERSRKERERLLYVGLTRGMDMLAFPEKLNITDKDKAENVSNSNLGLVIPGLSVEGLAAGENQTLRLGESLTAQCSVRCFASDAYAAVQHHADRVWFADRKEAGSSEILPFRLSPSHLENKAANAAFSIVKSGSPFPLRAAAVKNDDDDDGSDFGTMVHDFFAGDDRRRSRESRLEHAKALALSRLPEETIDHEAMIASHDALSAFLDETYPSWREFREMPVRFRENGQLISGCADLVLSDGSSFVLIDYKPFGGTHDACVSHAAKYAAQLEAYAKGISFAGGGRCEAVYLYYAAANCIVRAALIEPETRR